MSRLCALFLCLPLAGCSAVCDLIGDYEGTFKGDAEGDFTLGISDSQDKGGDPVVAAAFGGDLDGAIASGTVSCEDGQFVLDIYIDDTPQGSFEGSMQDNTGSGTWEVDDGRSGTWDIQ